MIIDMHCDSVLEAFQENRKMSDRSTTGHFDLPRMQEAGVKIQFFALFPSSNNMLILIISFMEIYRKLIFANIDSFYFLCCPLVPIYLQ
jgi:membrane dipeptidase